MKPAVPQRPARPRSAARGPRASLFCPRAPGGAGNHPTPAGKVSASAPHRRRSALFWAFWRLLFFTQLEKCPFPATAAGSRALSAR